MASADSTENLPSSSCCKRPISDVSTTESDGRVLSQKRYDFCWCLCLNFSCRQSTADEFHELFCFNFREQRRC